MPRFQRIDPSEYDFLQDDDHCVYIGEYASGEGYAGEINQQIVNIKRTPTELVAAPKFVYWKDRAIDYWGRRLLERLSVQQIQNDITFVPAPSSKAVGDPDHDDRLERILHHIEQRTQGMDIRPVIETANSRECQHQHGRLSVDEMVATMTVDQSQLEKPLRPIVVVFDDVMTRGATYKAMQRLLAPIPNTGRVIGVFLARAKRKPVDFAALFGN
nr:hypothetical protein [Dyella sp. ASV24]